MRGLIVTGISTDVGKTVVASVLAKALDAHYWKPIEAGGDDTGEARRMSEQPCIEPAYRLDHYYELMQLGAPLALPDVSPIVIEGSGGVLAPYGESHLGELFSRWELPWVVVAAHYVGSINHTLLTLEWLKTNQQKVLGLVFNGEPNERLEQTITNFTKLPVIGCLLPEKTLNSGRIAWYAKHFRQSGTLLHRLASIQTLSPL